MNDTISGEQPNQPQPYVVKQSRNNDTVSGEHPNQTQPYVAQKAVSGAVQDTSSSTEYKYDIKSKYYSEQINEKSLILLNHILKTTTNPNLNASLNITDTNIYGNYVLNEANKKLNELKIYCTDIFTCYTNKTYIFNKTKLKCDNTARFGTIGNIFSKFSKIYSTYPSLVGNNKELVTNLNQSVINQIVQRMTWENVNAGFNNYLQTSDNNKEELTSDEITATACAIKNTYIIHVTNVNTTSVMISPETMMLVRKNDIKYYEVNINTDVNSRSFLDCIKNDTNASVFIYFSSKQSTFQQFLEMKRKVQEITTKIDSVLPNISILNETDQWILNQFNNKLHKVINCYNIGVPKSIVTYYGDILLPKTKEKYKTEYEAYDYYNITLLTDFKRETIPQYDYFIFLKTEIARKNANIEPFLKTKLDQICTNYDTFSLSDDDKKHIDVLYKNSEIKLRDYIIRLSGYDKDDIPPYLYDTIKGSYTPPVTDTTSYPFKSPVDNKTYLFYEIRNRKKSSNDWWIDYCLRSPPCARNRLLQLDGTCWFSSVINCMLLTDALFNWWSKIEYDQGAFDIFEKLIKDQNDQSQTNNTNNVKRTRRSNKNAVKDFRKKTENDYFLLEDYVKKNILLDFLHRIHHGSLKVNDHTILFLSKMINPKISKQNDGYHPFPAIQYMVQIFGDKSAMVSECTSLYGIDYQIENLPVTQPDIIIFGETSPGEHGLKKIVGNYKIACSVIGIGLEDSTEKKKVKPTDRDRNGHAIAGLFCGDEPYIYDANNIVARNTHWYRGFEWENSGGYYINYNKVRGLEKTRKWLGSNIEDLYVMYKYSLVVYAKVNV
jgi:hypothetical protein